MIIIHLLALVGGTFLLGYWLKERFASVLPLSLCGLVLCLYILSFVNHLSYVDGLAVLVLLLLALCGLLAFRRDRCLQIGNYVKREASSGAFLWAILMTLFICLVASKKVVTWWDDYNFWATDLKSLFALDGFAGRYANVAPEFGDYPPGTQYMKWWVMHITGGAFSEAKAFIGYYLFLFATMLPLFGRLDGKKRWLVPALVPVAWLLPAVAEVYGYEGFCSDLVMAVLYGNFLYAAVDMEEHRDLFYFGRMALYLAVLVLCKSTGFFWALFGLVFLLLVYLNRPASERSMIKHLAVVMAPLVSGGSWLLFCLRMHRVTKTTSTAVTYLTTDQYDASAYAGDYVKPFLQAFFGEPLHKNHSGLLDLSPVLYLLIVIAMVYFFYRVGLFGKKLGKACLWFPIVSGVLFYSIIFLAHITIFAMETQYLEASAMIASIERYGAPFTIGMLLFLGMIAMNRVEDSNWMPALALIMIVLVCTDYSAAWHGAVGYRKEIGEKLEERANATDGIGRQFLDTITEKIPGGNARVMGLYTDDTYQRVRNTYIAYEASPVSTMFATLWYNTEIDLSLIIQTVASSHADYLYVFEGEKDIAPVLNQCTPEGAFSYNTLYKVAYEAGTMVLYAVP